MSEFTFESNRISRAAQNLSYKGKMAFALSCSERLYPNYCAFSRESGWGTPKAIREALDLGWRVLEGETIDGKELRRLQAMVESAEPDTEKFNSILVSSALDSAAAAGLLLNLIEKDDANILAQIASLCRDTVDMYVQNIEGMDSSASDLEEKIFQHPLMQEELRRQREDINALLSFAASQKEVDELSARWRSPARGNIDVS